MNDPFATCSTVHGSFSGGIRKLPMCACRGRENRPIGPNRARSDL